MRWQWWWQLLRIVSKKAESSLVLLGRYSPWWQLCWGTESPCSRTPSHLRTCSSLKYYFSTQPIGPASHGYSLSTANTRISIGCTMPFNDKVKSAKLNNCLSCLYNRDIFQLTVPCSRCLRAPLAARTPGPHHHPNRTMNSFRTFKSKI